MTARPKRPVEGAEFNPLVDRPRTFGELTIAARVLYRLKDPTQVRAWAAQGINRAQRRAMLKQLAKTLGPKVLGEVEKISALAARVRARNMLAGTIDAQTHAEAAALDDEDAP